jgi:hypothetical protein
MVTEDCQEKNTGWDIPEVEMMRIVLDEPEKAAHTVSCLGNWRLSYGAAIFKWASSWKTSCKSSTTAYRE